MVHHFTLDGATRANCGDWWKALSAKQKQPFNDQAATDRARFNRESQQRDKESIRDAEEMRLQNSADGPTKERARPSYIKDVDQDKVDAKNDAVRARKALLDGYEARIADATDKFTLDSVEDEKDRNAL